MRAQRKLDLAGELRHLRLRLDRRRREAERAGRVVAQRRQERRSENLAERHPVANPSRGPAGAGASSHDRAVVPVGPSGFAGAGR